MVVHISRNTRIKVGDEVRSHFEEEYGENYFVVLVYTLDSNSIEIEITKVGDE